MKKFAAIIISVLVFAMLLGATAFAGEGNESMLALLKEEIPAGYSEVMYPQFEKIVNQLDISNEQVEGVKTIIAEVKSKVNDKGSSLHSYSADTQSYVLGKAADACSLLGLTYKLETKTSGLAHAGDQVFAVYKDGVKLGTIDGEIEVAKTGIY